MCPPSKQAYAYIRTASTHATHYVGGGSIRCMRSKEMRMKEERYIYFTHLRVIQADCVSCIHSSSWAKTLELRIVKKCGRSTQIPNDVNLMQLIGMLSIIQLITPSMCGNSTESGNIPTPAV